MFRDGRPEGSVTVNRHPNKVSVHETDSSPGIPERGWLDMDVRWLITKDTVGASKTVFGVTYFPPGSKHELHRHPNAEEVEYLISGTGIAYVDDDAVALGPGEVVFVPQNAYHGFENNSDSEVVMAWSYAGAASLEDAGFVTRREDVEAEAAG
jgi:oxalate decarboxylase/phosphoglucose isomerase-like protein (cupin superfamily)